MRLDYKLEIFENQNKHWSSLEYHPFYFQIKIRILPTFSVVYLFNYWTPKAVALNYIPDRLRSILNNK